MADVKEKTTHRADETTGRDRYISPILKEFGPVGALTQTGTTGMAETGMPNDDMRDIMG